TVARTNVAVTHTAQPRCVWERATRRQARSVRRRGAGGSAHTMAVIGAPAASRGAATDSSSTCCTMWRGRLVVACWSRGDTSATSTTSTPPANAATWTGFTIRPAPAADHSRCTPLAYRNASGSVTGAPTVSGTETGPEEEDVGALGEDQHEVCPVDEQS